MNMPGRVYLVGAGPGDPELLTLRADRLIAQAQSLVYDRLVSREILARAHPKARLIPVGKKPKQHPVPQDAINRILVDEARVGRMVVRLKGGDPFIFGRGSEEALALRNAGIHCEVVPGITAAQGCAARAGVPLTHRGLATSVRYITGHFRSDSQLDFDWRGLADPETTLVVYMGAANIGEIAERLHEAGLPDDTPVLAIASGTTSTERRIVTQLSNAAKDVVAQSFTGPVLFIVGAVVSLYASDKLCPALNASVAALAFVNGDLVDA